MFDCVSSQKFCFHICLIFILLPFTVYPPLMPLILTVVVNIYIPYLIFLFSFRQSIFISRVSEDGPAGKAGILKGDKLLQVNDQSLVGADHYDAVNVLKNSGDDITMVIARERLIADAQNEVITLLELIM